MPRTCSTPEIDRVEKLLNEHLHLPEDVSEYSADDAIRLLRFTIRVNPHEPFLYFYLATFYSAINSIRKSLFYYEEALKRGYSDWEKIFSDPSFQRARQTERFKAITARYSAR